MWDVKPAATPSTRGARQSSAGRRETAGQRVRRPVASGVSGVSREGWRRGDVLERAPDGRGRALLPDVPGARGTGLGRARAGEALVEAALAQEAGTRSCWPACT